MPHVLESFAQAEARGRPRAGRGRRQRVGDQSARQRHRQYGLCPRRRRAGGGDRRHRPRRRHRQPRRHQGGARRRRCGDGPRLHRQQAARRPGAVRRRHGGRSPSAPAGRRSGCVPFFAEARRLPAEDALGLVGPQRAQAGAPHPDRRADPAAYRQFRRSRPAGGGARGRGGQGAAGRGAARRCRSRDPAGLEGDHRRSRRAARRPAWTSTSRRMCGAAAMCSGCAAATRCWAARSPIPDGIEGPPGTVAGLGPAGCRDRARRREDARSASAARRPTAFPSPATRCMWARPQGPDCARPFARLATAAPTARSRPTAGSPAPMCTACSPTTASARPGSRGSARGRRPSATRPASRRRSTRSPRISRRHVDLDRLLSLAR